MEESTGKVVEEVIYETRQHAAGIFSQDLFKHEGRGAGKGLLSYFSIKGAKQLKQKWDEYWRQSGCNRKMTLFVSHDGEHVAVAFENQLVIVQKDDDYMEPCGTYIGNDRLSFFIKGVWMEPQGILGVVDNTSTLYLINSNGREISKWTRSELKLTTSIIDLLLLDDVKVKKSYMSVFGIFTADGSVHFFEVAKEPNPSIYPRIASNYHLKDGLPHNISCFDFHPDLSLIVLLDALKGPQTLQSHHGFYSLYLLQMATNFDIESVFCSPQYEGLFSSTKSHLIALTSPKVSISPQGKYIAALDFTGCLDVFRIDSGSNSLSMLCCAERPHSPDSIYLAEERKNNFKNIIDICWWADHVLILANSNGFFTMYDVLRGRPVLKNGRPPCILAFERPRHSQGHAFILEARSREVRESEPKQSDHDSKNDLLNNRNVPWSLLSISGKSVFEMYRILISKQHYNSALEFADCHGLDKDELYKAQWISSSYEAQDVDQFLSKISDREFVLSECLKKVGPTEDSVKALLSYGIHVTDDYCFSNLCDEEEPLVLDFRVARLQLLQYRDKLDTFVGINMGRFLAEEYSNFRVVPVTNTAIKLAEHGKIGALNLLFKRHAYSLSQDILHVLSAIPETVPVQTYGQLLPGKSPQANISLRENDWVECEHMLSFFDKIPGGHEKLIQLKTENIVKLSVGFVWPSIAELIDWYISRARGIDSLSGQLENCLALVELACRKDILELQQFLDDITYLHQLIYCDECTEDFNMGLVQWEQLPNYDKFKMLLNGITEDSAVKRLHEKAIPFMQKHFHYEQVKFVEQKNDVKLGGSFLVRWLKEVASDNKLGICLKIFEVASREISGTRLFKDETELVDTALDCIYSCTLTDQWNVMTSILLTLPRKSLREKSFKDITTRHGNSAPASPRFSYIRSHLSKSVRQSGPLNSSLTEELSGLQNSGCAELLDFSVVDDNVENRIKCAAGHVEVGRLLAFYQVPKPISFFLSAESDEKNVKQLIRLILSKFARRQPGRSDSEWASMWQDMQCFQEKSFSFLDAEYMLLEFCRGLLKAGKFSLARTYLKGTGCVNLATEKAEVLVVQAAREYFFSASSLTCSEIWKARECLGLFPTSKAVQSEADVIEALTVRLPNLGVTLLPVQYKQIRNPMEIINMVISSQTGAYLNVEELIEVAKLLGLGSPDDIAAVEEAIARESAVAGDLHLASDLCLVLAKKGHGPIWDLCAAIARSPHVDNMDSSSRKQLLGFALSHCDDESIGELLNAWKDVDMRMNYEQLIQSTGTSPPNFSVHGSTVVSLPVNSLQDIWSLRDMTEHIKYDSKKDDKMKVHFESLKNILSEVAEESSTESSIGWDSLLRENRKVLAFSALELPWLLELSSKKEYERKIIPGTKVPFKNHSVSIKFLALINILQKLARNDIAPRDELLILLVKSIMVSPVTEEDDALACSFLLNLSDAFRGVEVIEEQLKQREKYQEIYSIMNIGMSYSSIQNTYRQYSSPDLRRELLLQKIREKYASFGSDEVEQIDEMHSTFWRQWNSKLEDQKRLAHQARVLEETVPGVDASRFLSADIEYIRGIVFSLVDSVKMQKKNILVEAVKLADTYGLQRIEVLCRFFGSVLVSEHWGNDDILAEISEYREDFSKCAKDVIETISTVAFPEISGHNKHRLAYIYSILSACHLRLHKTKESASSLGPQHQPHSLVEPFHFYKILEQECQRVSFIEELDFKSIASLDKLNFDKFNQEIISNTRESTVEALAIMAQNLVGMYSDTDTKDLISWPDIYKHHVKILLTSLERRAREKLDEKTPKYLEILLAEVDANYNLCKKYIIALPELDALHIIHRFQKLCIPTDSSQIPPDDPEWRHLLILVLELWKKLFFNEESMPKFLIIFQKLVMEGQISVTDSWRAICNLVHQTDDVAISDITSFMKSMIVSGCGFKPIAEVYFEEPQKRPRLLDLYISLIETALSDIHNGFFVHQNLHRLLSSLSKVEGAYTEELMVIRSEVWIKLSKFSDSIQQDSSIKVYALELMQCITGQNYKNVPGELISEVDPWDDFHESCQLKALETVQGRDWSSNITSTLIALKSAKLIAAVIPGFTITAEDLATVDSAVSCFLNLCKSSASLENIEVLKAVLEEWEVLFTADDSVKEHSEWSNDDWDEGWETLPDELIQVEEKERKLLSRPLHACWMELVRMLIVQSRFSEVLDLLDQPLSNYDKPLLDEDEANSLFHTVLGIDCFMALKFVLLLPHDGPRLRCLQAIESHLKQKGTPNLSHVDECELLILVLTSGVLQSIIFDPLLDSFFSYICYLVGHLARICQEDLLKYKDGKFGTSDRRWCLRFGRLLLPSFVAELVQAKQCILAGFVVAQWMHTPPSMALMDVIEASLKKYLEGQLVGGHEDVEDEFGVYDESLRLRFALSRLGGKVRSLVQSALLVFAPNV